MTLAREKALEAEYVVGTFARKPVEFVEGHGMMLVDDAGKEYFDFLSGIGVCSLGHCPPAIVKAVSDQAAKLIHVSNYYYIEHRGEVAQLTLAATAQPAKQEAFQPLPAGFTATPINDVEALEQLFATQGDRICAVMIECIQGESGVHPCTEEFIGAIRRLTAEHGALMICDEVQSGIFRTGVPFGFQNFDVLPDIVTMAKGIASGIVAGACAARASIADTFAPGDHGTTFGGSNIAMAAAHATLTTLLAPGTAARIQEVGVYMREQLAGLPHVQEVRGYGLMNGIDLTHEAPAAPDVVAAGLEAGLVLNATGPHTLRFLPPLICTTDDVDVLVERLRTLL